ncbi:MAG: DUF4129 domain-containing protein [Prevotella sp.]|nr:DUF4129 domain-containing protein [Prevotella sp.]
MTAQDTLRVDTELLEQFQNSGDFDYGRELVAPDFNVLEWLTMQIRNFLNDIFNSETMAFLEPKFWLLVAIILLIAAIAYYLIKRPEFFKRTETEEALDYEVTEDNIYGVDFSKEIVKAVERSDWHEAVRLTYLNTLRWLSDHEKINWRPSKTPTQYTREITSNEFRTLTQHFMRVRYGNFKATRDLYEECQRLSDVEMGKQESATTDEKGGQS